MNLLKNDAFMVALAAGNLQDFTNGCRDLIGTGIRPSGVP
jgi:hypothetical protein